ncbi:MAG: MFS transporter [Rhabdochlamydiaceae bacterium]|jgi:DHA1 family tetracycline resistance protein-like MFS transporter
MQSQTRRILVPYAIVILLAYVSFSLPLPIFPAMFLDPIQSIIPDATLQKRMVLLGLIMASFPLGQFFGSPILGRLSDRHGRKKIILISLVGTTIGYLITAISVHFSSIWGMFLGLASCGFCEGNVTIAQSVIADLTTNEKTQTEKAVHFGWINIFISIGFIIGPLMGGQLADPTVVSWFTFSTPFWFAAGLTVIGMGIIFWYSKETLKKKGDKGWKFLNAIWSGINRPRLKGFLVANFFLALGYFAFFRFFPVFLQQRFDLTTSQLSLVMVYDSLAIAAGVIWLVPFLSKRFQPVQSLCSFAFFLAIAFVICLLPKSPYALLVTLIPLGFCLAVVITNGALLISNTASQQFQGQAMGTLTSVQVLAELITGLAGGPLAAYVMTLPLYVGAAMSVVCTLILLNSIRTARSVR